MSNFASRRGFLTGRLPRRAISLRPPWAISESSFLSSCTRCDDCRAACPTGIIGRLGDNGYPEIDFSAGECTFCGACVAVCRTGALQRRDGDFPWRAKATLTDQCLAWRRIECRICADQCQARAIRFPPQAGAVAAPLIESARCTGCGACVGPCPVMAIRVLGDDRR